MQYHKIALTRLQLELEKRSDDYRLHVALGQTHAALGQRDKAILHSERAAELMPMSLDLMNGAEVIYEMTQAYIRLGDVDRALDDMEILLSRPVEFSVGLMAVEPAYDPIRENPRFKDLMAKYAPPLP